MKQGLCRAPSCGGRIVDGSYGFVVPNSCASVSLTVAMALPCQSCAGVSLTVARALLYPIAVRAYRTVARALPCQSCADVSDDSYGCVVPKLCGRIGR